jgi:hypothetical protein
MLIIVKDRLYSLLIYPNPPAPGKMIVYLAVMSKRCLLFSALVLLAFKTTAQNITAFVDNDGTFKVFDNGNTSLLESQAPMSFEVGGNCVAYLDVNNLFKIYFKGEVLKPYGDRIISRYSVTNNFVLFNVGKHFMVFDQGEAETLSTNCYNVSVTDSLVVLQDYYTNQFQVYYNHRLTTLESPGPDFLYYPKLGTMTINYYNDKISKNTLAYVCNDTLKVFWNGYTRNIFSLSNQRPATKNSSQNYFFEVGKNIVCYLNPAAKTLNAFYKGSNYILNSGSVDNVNVGDDMVTYRDSSGLNVFYAGEKYLLDELNTSKSIRYTGSPFGSSNLLKDSLVVFYSSGRTEVFNKGKITIIDNIQGTQYKIAGNTLAWLDKMNNLNAFYNNQTYTLSTLLKPSDFEVHGNTVWFNTFPNTNKVFYCGKIY